jgi:hypothetical protein
MRESMTASREGERMFRPAASGFKDFWLCTRSVDVSVVLKRGNVKRVESFSIKVEDGSRYAEWM